MITTSSKRHLQVFQETAVLHQLGDDVDRLLLRTHCVQLDQPGRIHGESTIVYICVMFNPQQFDNGVREWINDDANGVEYDNDHLEWRKK